MDFIFKEEVSYIVIIGMAVFGVLLHFIRSMAYRKYIKESARIETTHNRCIRQLVDTAMSKKNVSNVDNFVDKCMYNFQFFGFKLYTWDKICGQNIIAESIIVGIMCVLGIYVKCGQDTVLLTLLIGMLCTSVLIMINMSSSTLARKNKISFNITDWIEENIIHGDVKNHEDEQVSSQPETGEELVQFNRNADRNSDNENEKDEHDKVKYTDNKMTGTKGEDDEEDGKKVLTLSSIKKADRQILQKAFSDAVYEAAMEKIASQVGIHNSESGTQNSAKKAHEHTKSHENKQEKRKTESAQSEVIEAFIKEMLQ